MLVISERFIYFPCTKIEIGKKYRFVNWWNAFKKQRPTLLEKEKYKSRKRSTKLFY